MARLDWRMLCRLSIASFTSTVPSSFPTNHGIFEPIPKKFAFLDSDQDYREKHR